MGTTGAHDPFGFGPAPDINVHVDGVAQKPVDLSSRFRPVITLAEGGMGRIVLAEEVLSRRYVALKIMRTELHGDTPLVQQFIREAVITARLQHPSIIPVYDLGFLSKGQLYYTMKYVEGKTLASILPDLSLGRRLRILRDAASAVHYAHLQGLWHRDLKPHNILVGAFGDTYVIDWGLVSVLPGADYKFELPRIVVEHAMLPAPDALLRETKDALTANQGMIIGTPTYMAPEQIDGDDAKMGAASDAWAFGVMLYECIAGKHPFRPKSYQDRLEMFYNIKRSNPPRLRDIGLDGCRAFDEVCTALLAKDSRLRLDNLDCLVSTIDQYLKTDSRHVPADGGESSELQELYMIRALVREERGLGVMAFFRKRKLRATIDRLLSGEPKPESSFKSARGSTYTPPTIPSTLLQRGPFWRGRLFRKQ